MMRYNRQIQLDEVGISGQRKIQDAKILIVGIGGLGCPAAQYLVGAGVGYLGLLDHDTVSLTNLHRQVLYDERDLGKSKARVAKEKLANLNTEVRIVALNEILTVENVEAHVSNYDLIIDGTDNFETKYLINDACIITGKPWIYGSVYKNEGQLSVFNYQNGPTYRCLFPIQALQNISCEETGVLGVVPGIVGMYQAMEALKIILGIGEVLSGKLKLWNFVTGIEQVFNIAIRVKEISEIKNKGITAVDVHCTLKNQINTYLDVREEFEVPKIISDRVICVPMSVVQERISEIPKHDTVFVFCQSGVRSLKVIALLEKKFKFQNLKNVVGGIKTIIDG